MTNEERKLARRLKIKMWAEFIILVTFSFLGMLINALSVLINFDHRNWFWVVGNMFFGLYSTALFCNTISWMFEIPEEEE